MNSRISNQIGSFLASVLVLSTAHTSALAAQNLTERAVSPADSSELRAANAELTARLAQVYEPLSSDHETGRPLLASPPVLPHGGHGQFSRYLIDPLFTHHAILEDELRVNSFADSQDGRTVWRTSVEVAYAFTDAFGVEIFLPVTRSEIPGVSATGIGDLEIQALKWSFVRRENLIMTAVLAGVVPTGNEDEGLGGGLWTVEPHLFMDAVIGPVALQVNGIYGFIEGGEQEVEFSGSLARMFFLSDRVSMGPMLEVMGGRVTRGGDAGEWEGLGLAPGAKLQVGGWHYGLGVRLPLVDNDASDLIVVATVGYHVSFGGLGPPSTPADHSHEVARSIRRQDAQRAQR